jgi:hypothetical protein
VRATEVVLLLKLGKNEVCLSTNYGRPRTLFPPTEVVLLLKLGRNEVCPATKESKKSSESKKSQFRQSKKSQLKKGGTGT